MIYSRDLWIQLPTKDLYNTQVMMAAVNAAKDMYDKGQKRLDDFYEKYGDFMSPFSKDMDRYGQLVLGITNPIEDMYAQGIDPLRSAEGRALVNRLVNAFPISEFNVMKANAKRGEQYLKDVSDLRSKGLFNQDYQNWLIGQQYGNGTTFENFDSSKGMWTTSPSEFKTIDDIVEPIVKNLTPIYDAEYSKQKNDGFDYYTVSPNRIAATLNDSMPDILKSDVGRYYMDTALKQTGGDPAAADALVKTWMVDRASDHVQIKREENPYSMLAAKERSAKRVADYNAARRAPRPSSNSNGGGSNAGSFVYTQQRMKQGIANLLTKSGFGDYIDVTNPNLVTGETKQSIRSVLKDAQRYIIDRSYTKAPKGTSSKQKRENYLTAISFGLGPETFAIAMGGTSPGIKDHPHARLISVDDDVLRRIYTDEDIVAQADGIKSTSKKDSSIKLRNTIKVLSNGTALKKIKDKKLGGFGKIYNNAIDLAQPREIAIEGSTAIGQVEKDGNFKEYVKINIYDKNGKNLFPNKNIYYFDSVVAAPNYRFDDTGKVNIDLDENQEQFDRMRLDKNYAKFLGTLIKGITADDLIPQEQYLDDYDYSLPLDMLE